MLISTMNDIPGYKVTSVLGEVFGLTVRSRNVGSQFGAAFKSLAGGELKGMTKNLQLSREDVTNRMARTALPPRASASSTMRFVTSSLLSCRFLVIPLSSPPARDLKAAPN